MMPQTKKPPGARPGTDPSQRLWGEQPCSHLTLGSWPPSPWDKVLPGPQAPSAWPLTPATLGSTPSPGRA